MDYNSPQPVMNPDKAFESSMPTAALTVGIIGVVFALVPYFGLICPAVAMTLALLSRGGNMNTAQKGKAALILGVIGVIIALAITIFSTYYLISSVDMNELFEELDIIYDQTGTSYL